MDESETLRLVDTRVDLRIAEIEFTLRTMSVDIKRLSLAVEQLQELVVGHGGPETLMALINNLTSAEKRRREEDVELKKMRRNLMLSVGTLIISSLGGILWAFIKLLP